MVNLFFFFAPLWVQTALRFHRPLFFFLSRLFTRAMYGLARFSISASLHCLVRKPFALTLNS